MLYTSLPIVVKGVLTIEDALLAVRHGVNMVSYSQIMEEDSWMVPQLRTVSPLTLKSTKYEYTLVLLLIELSAYFVNNMEVIDIP